MSGKALCGRAWLRFLAAVAMVASTLPMLAATASPAAAETSTISVTPSAGLHGGDTVSVHVTGADFTHHTVMLCSADLLSTADPASFSVSYCDIAAAVNFDLAPGSSTDVNLTVDQVFSSIGGPGGNCGQAPGDCLIVDFDHTLGSLPTAVGGYVPVSFGVQEASLTVSPSTGVAPVETVAVTGAGFAQGSSVTLRECVASWVASPSAATADASCSGPLESSTVPVGGAISTAVRVSDPLVTVSGEPVPCGHDACVLVAGTTISFGDAILASTTISFGDFHLTSTPSPVGLGDTSVQVTVTTAGRPDEQVVVSLCAPGFVLETCDGGSTTIQVVNGVGTGVISIGTAQWAQVIPGLPPIVTSIDCRDGSACYLQATSSSGSILGHQLPLTFIQTPKIVLSSTFVAGGAPLPFTGRHLQPNTSYRVRPCDETGKYCDAGVVVNTAADGTFSGSVTATSNPGKFGVCYSGCTVRARPVAGGSELVATYTVQAGFLLASPSTGLTDGQTVTLTATNLAPTYGGRTIIVPTGGWVSGVCNKSVADNPTLVAVLTQCGIPSGAGALQIPAQSTVNQTITVPAHVTALLGGGTIDCTANGGTGCVLAVARWEQDATVSFRSLPITFATPS